jgi:hypothetical protein
MADICSLILDDHETFRRRFAELDDHHDSDAAALAKVWGPLGTLLDLHAAAEEEVFYPQLLAHGDDATDETTDAIKDHNKIRDAVRDANDAHVGSDAWWQAVGRARKENTEHMGEEEDEGLADFRKSAPTALREELGARFMAFKREHARGRDFESEDKDPEGYVEQESP